MMTINSFVASVLVCANILIGLGATDAFGSEYLVPETYEPDSGKPVDGGFRITSAEFAVTFTEEELADSVPGFLPRLAGVNQDIYVIVNVYDPAIHDDWEPDDTIISNWDSIWNMTGGFSRACIAPDLDELTGYVRYYTYCEPGRNPNSSFFLMDRRPEKDKPRPDSQDYIKGICSIEKSSIQPQTGPFHNCRFLRRTRDRDRFSFRLRGDNVKLLPTVEEYIRSQIESWKIE